MALKHVNAVIVGAGAGGGVAAKELAEAGLSVVLLERGRWQSFDDHDDDELHSQMWYTPLGTAFGPDDRHRRVLAGGDGSTRIVFPNDGGYNTVAACVGSGTVSYGAMAWRFMPQDFRLYSAYKAIADGLKGHTLVDWPISYDELEPCYEKAEWEIGVAGDERGNPFSPPRKKPHPMPAFPYNLEGRLIEQAAKKLGWHPFPIPMLRNSIPYNGRNQCIHMRSCCGFACPINAKNGTHNTVIPKAIATGNCELRTGCMAAEVVVDDRGRATAVRYFDAKGKPQEQPADIVIVAASATETARLLLNSKSKLFPNGAGNNHDWVGRNLQGHGYTGAIGLFDQDVYEEAGPGACVAVSDFNHNLPGVIGGGVLTNDFIRLPYSFSQTRPGGESRWGRGHKDFQRQFHKRHIMFRGPLQEIPAFDARVSVDPNVRDDWGIPVARLSGSRHPHDIEIGKAMADKAELLLKEMGAIRTWQTVPGMGLSGGQHQAGTCRMGDDPKTSVTDRHGKVHGIDNLFIADGSLNVTNGGFNPVLTILALGYWVSAHIRKEWQAIRGGR